MPCISPTSSGAPSMARQLTSECQNSAAASISSRSSANKPRRTISTFCSEIRAHLPGITGQVSPISFVAGDDRQGVITPPSTTPPTTRPPHTPHHAPPPSPAPLHTSPPPPPATPAPPLPLNSPRAPPPAPRFPLSTTPPPPHTPGRGGPFSKGR